MKFIKVDEIAFFLFSGGGSCDPIYQKVLPHLPVQCKKVYSLQTEFYDISC